MYEGRFFMSKDSQPDNKEARMEKSNGQILITRKTSIKIEMQSVNR
jgi:hypothetical protein